ncbi:pisatin demethylase cytochrome P450 [Fusarium mundagurra]|uniref:Pisatin demethylase cytochrome P450 n=1 Tax=Fusarium mundagurra TaxID=1567541 RepID=A0A8H5YGD8_9HYPO|nr:pisatin demethylase cytochrome P450 [Fusarium mundagurra]
MCTSLQEKAHSCFHCEQRFLIRDCNDPQPLIHIDDPKSDHYWRLWPPNQEPITLSELKQMANLGCAFAEYIFLKFTSRKEVVSENVIVNRVPPAMGDTEPNSIVVTLSGDNHHETNSYFTYMTEQGSSTADEVFQRPPNLLPASPHAFSLARKWAHECLQNHTSCASPSVGFMPTRIIKIFDSGKRIEIVERNSPAAYAVLSYCWGGPQRITLSKARVKNGQLSFDTSTLPQTLQDAVRVCGELGLSFLWVDALCIIQDVPEDKATEIGQMAKIFENSYVAIMASRAKSVEEGFLHPRSHFGADRRSPGFRLQYETKNGRRGSVVLVEESSSQTYADPLSLRAWAYQEFILSPRILDYGELRTTWICRADINPTDGFLSTPTSYWSRQRFQEIMSPSIEANSVSPHQLWSTLVQCYMRSSITDPYDRLPALAGIAERLNTIIKDEYIAGCWKSNIWLDLLWWHEDGRSRMRPARYFAPSWSWASIPNGNLNYISTRSCVVDEGFEVLHHDIKLSYPQSQYGTVTAGSLFLQGRIIPEEYLPDLRNREFYHDPIHIIVNGQNSIAISCSVIPDYGLESFYNRLERVKSECYRYFGDVIRKLPRMETSDALMLYHVRDKNRGTCLAPTMILDLFLQHPWAYLTAALIGLLATKLLINKYGNGLNGIPGPALASFTDLWRFLDVYRRRPEVTQIALHEKHGSVVRLGPNTVSIADPAAIQTIYAHNSGYTKSDFYPVQQTINKSGKRLITLFTSQDEKFHSQLRRSVSNAYAMSTLVQFEPFVDSTTTEFFKQLDQRYANQNDVLDFGTWLQYYAFDVIGELTYSKRLGFVDHGKDVDNIIGNLEWLLNYAAPVGQLPILDSLLLKNPLRLQLTKWGFTNSSSPVAIFARNRMLARVDPEKLGDMKFDQDNGRRDFLSRFLEANQKDPEFMNNDRVLALTVANMFAGSDTTAITFRAIFYYLMKNPDDMRTLMSELAEEEKAGRFTRDDGLVSWNEVRDLPFLNAVVKEALRCHPAAGLMLERIVPARGLEVDGHHIPGGTIVGVNPWVLHRNKDIFGHDADRWRPSRWIEASTEQKRRMENYMFAFGAGSRTCIGKNISLLEMYKMVPALLRRYEASLVSIERPFTEKLDLA